MQKLYHILRRFNESFSYLLLALFVASFFFAFVLMFVYPLGSLILLFLGLGGLWGSAIIRFLARFIERYLARTMMKDGVCPNCAESWGDNPDDSCPSCNASFTKRGEALVHEQADVSPAPLGAKA